MLCLLFANMLEATLQHNHSSEFLPLSGQKSNKAVLKLLFGVPKSIFFHFLAHLVISMYSDAF